MRHDRRLELMRLLVLLVMAPMPLAAQSTGPQPSYEAGDTFIYSNGTVERFVAEEDGGLRWQSLSGRAYIRDRNFYVPILDWETSTTRGTRFVLGQSDRVWPLERHRRASFSVTGDLEVRERGEAWADSDTRRETQHWRCRAGRSELIAVPAGEFDVVPIVCDRYSADTMRVLRRRTWYYAPDVGHYIRREDISFSSGEQSTRDLIAALPGRLANEARIGAVLADWREQSE